MIQETFHISHKVFYTHISYEEEQKIITNNAFIINCLEMEAENEQV